MWTGFARLGVGAFFGIAAYFILKALPSQSATVAAATLIIALMATFYVNEPREDNLISH